MKNKFKYLAAFILLLISSSNNQLFAQDAATIQQQIENKQFSFVTTSVSPLRGANKIS